MMAELVLMVVGLFSIVAFAGVIVSLNRMQRKAGSDIDALKI